MTSTGDLKAAPSTPSCKLCGSETVAFGEKPGSVVKVSYRFSRCKACNFISVVNPCLDFSLIYNEDYYRGEGADPLVDYGFELDQPALTIRQYEWRGLEQVVRQLVGPLRDLRWLDYGCGNGALVRYLRERNIDAVGFDEGGIVPLAREKGIPILTASELEAEAGHFSIITMIEVIEHVPDPLPLLRTVRRLLKPGGLLFLTTGNSAPVCDRFVNWGYVMPDIHVSYFDPRNLQLALTKSGFDAHFVGYLRGWDDIIRFKVLKKLGWRKVGFMERLVPWPIASPLIDRYVRSSEHPVARAV